MGLAILLTAIPLWRDLLVRQWPASGQTVAAIGYLALLAACLITMRVAGITVAQVGLRRISFQSVMLGGVAGLLVIAPVWHWPSLSVSRASWLVVAVVVEEVAFRGVLFTMLRRAGGLPLAIGGSAAVFTMAHAGGARWPSLVLVSLAGMYLALLRGLRGDLWTPGIAHLLMDLVSLP